MAKLQVVCIDNDTVQTADLQLGNNTIGRGSATEYGGKKDIKRAVTINLAANDEMTITPANGDIKSDIPEKKSYLESLALDASAGETVNQNTSDTKHETEKENVDNEHKHNNRDAGDSVVEIQEVHEASSSVDVSKKHDSQVEEKVEDKGDAGSEILEENSNNTAKMVESRDSPVPMDVDEPSSSVNINKNIQRRDKCRYGKSCYRKNPQHKTQFCHPGDSDYDTPDDRVECPYGTRCYRKNPQHRKDFKHTRRVSKPRRKRTDPNRTSNSAYADESSEEVSAEESVDESEYEPTSEEHSSEEDSYWDQSGNGSELDDGTTG